MLAESARSMFLGGRGGGAFNSADPAPLFEADAKGFAGRGGSGGEIGLVDVVALSSHAILSILELGKAGGA
jgi:hypothetical protein